MKKLDAEQNKLIWLTPAPANNTWTIAVRQDIAQKNKLESLADLGRYLKDGGRSNLPPLRNLSNGLTRCLPLKKPMISN